ncbi:hypothetical protein KP77_08500 [Jeotgalibacillus alimentarius]|uniref:Uncharacterized protein n=1 Tax=Jeotgalibacillus alimentarius TaxID=135826 RepID=A0A0C2W5M6_9BACL|nr:hypothetical protein [Jeotgalibacillus alimentarius]KIL51338.1 hypothetical protein KP77_08500 [Jeotgalibacillus alimentarius]
MRKPVIIAFILFFGLAGIIFASNQFEKSRVATVQFWDQEMQVYEDISIVLNDEEQKELRTVLNQSDYKARQSEMAVIADVKLTITYDHNRQETIYLWKESGQYSRFTSSEKEGTFILKNSEAKRTIEEILSRKEW